MDLSCPSQPHLCLPHPLPMDQELCLSSALGLCLICAGEVSVALAIWPCLANSLSLVLDLPGDLRTSDLVTSLELLLTCLLSLTSSPGMPLCGHLAEAGCHPGPILLTLLRFCGTGQWPARSQPCYHFYLCVPRGAASRYFEHLEARQGFIWLFDRALPFSW